MTDEKMSQQFQTKAHEFAHHAALRLRAAATKLEEAFTGEPLAQDAMDAVEALGSGVWAAQSCIAHAAHQSALAVLHRERERNGGAR